MEYELNQDYVAEMLRGMSLKRDQYISLSPVEKKLGNKTWTDSSLTRNMYNYLSSLEGILPSHPSAEDAYINEYLKDNPTLGKK